MILPYRTPYHWRALADFLAARATPGVEHVEAGAYRRVAAADGQIGVIEVRPSGDASLAVLTHGTLDVSGCDDLSARVRRMFDLDAAPDEIGAHLSRDALLRPLVAAHPGIRLPGAWDVFELAVRAVLGQQVSVRAATTIAGRMAAAFGTPVAIRHGLNRVFPGAEQLADAPLEQAGIMPARARTIRALAREVAEGRLRLDAGAHRGDATRGLLDVPGIGPWTVSYIAMRGWKDADAFPDGDLVLRRAAGGLTARELERRAEAWRPWRAYAAMLLWRGVA